MSTFRAFQTGLMAGQQQAKVRREDDARVKAANAFGSGNYEGAVASLMGVGLMQDADAYAQAGERHKEKERTETYANAFKTGLSAGGPKQAATATMEAAGAQGDIKTVAALDQFIANSDDRAKKAFADSMSFFGSTAIQLKNVPPEARGQAAMEILQGSPFSNPQILSQIQQAAADGRITDDELDAFALQTMSAGDRVKQAMDQAKLEETRRHNQAMETRQSSGGITIGQDENGNPVVQIGGAPAASKAAAAAFGTGKGKDSATRLAAVKSSGDIGRKQLNTVQELKATLGQVGYQGFGAMGLVQLQKVGRAFGLDIGEDVPAAEAANMVRNQMALSMKQDLPGPMSNADREFLVSIPPNISNTPQGNQAIMFILEKRAQMLVDMDASLRAANPQTPEQYDAWENDYIQQLNSKPYFSKATADSLRKALSGQ